MIEVIRRAKDALVEALAAGLRAGPLGFEIVQRYPLRVLQEAITNAILHRDYRVEADVHIRVFDHRVDVESPGLFPGAVATHNIGRVGSVPRNRLLVDHLREFPSPPNLDAGEGVPMMNATMELSKLYPPLYRSRPDLVRDAVCVTLFNQARPSVWAQIEKYVDAHGTIGNAEVRRLLGTDDTLGVSKQIRSWVEAGMLVVANPEAGNRLRRYRRPGAPQDADLLFPSQRK